MPGKKKKRNLAEELRSWEEKTYHPFRVKAGERKKAFQTTSGIEIKPLYTPPDSPDSSYFERLAFPGAYPYTRGVYPTMFRGKFWTMRQYAGFRLGRGDEPAVPLPPRKGTDGALDSVRSSDADGI